MAMQHNIVYILWSGVLMKGYIVYSQKIGEQN